MVEYGLKTGNLKEKEVVKIISQLLEDYFKKNSEYDTFSNYNLSKKKNLGGVSGNPERIEYDYEYQYEIFHKAFGLYVELYPNVNKNGDIKYKENGVMWNLLFNETGFYRKKLQIINENNPDIINLISHLLDGFPFETVLIKEYKQGEERL